MKKTNQMYEGKAKKVFETDNPDYVIVDYKDDATAFNGLKKGTIVGKGAINNVMSNHMFQLLEQQGVQAEVVKLNLLTPLDPELVVRSVRHTGAMLVAEDCVERGGVGQRLAAALERAGVCARVCLVNCGEAFVPHGALSLLKQKLELDGAGIARRALEVLGRG